MNSSITLEARAAIENLNYEWARLIDENKIEAIGDLMTESADYKVASRFNVDRNLPSAVIHCRSRAQLLDRITAMRVANIYEKQCYRHVVSGVQVLGAASDFGANAWETRANYVVIRTMEHDGSMIVYSTGQYCDVVVFEGDAPKFARRHVVYDSRMIETVLVIPI
ncbi:MAG: nuclear transport factor 2 family protein [Burkholderiales bacterium]